MRQTVRFQLRLIICHLGGIAVEFVVMPYFLAGGLELGNVVLAWVLGVVLFFALAVAGGLVWRRSVMTRPVRWAIASPAFIPAVIFLMLGGPGGFAPDDAQLALEASLVGGLCALFSSMFFLVWAYFTSRPANLP